MINTLAKNIKNVDKYVVAIYNIIIDKGKCLQMIKFFVKSFFSYIVLAFIFCFMYFFASSILNEMGLSLTSGATFGLILMCIILVWLFTKLLSKIAHSISFMYWLFCVGIAIFTYFISLNKPIDVSIIFLHFAGLMFFIPELQGEWATYLNTETYYDGYGSVVSERSWTSEEYTPGCIKKLVVMVILTAVMYFLVFSYGQKVVLIIFYVEVIYAGALTVMNAIKFFSNK